MAMLFGGWTKEEEELVNEQFEGDWNKYKEFKIQERIRISEQIKEVEEFVNGVGRFDIICTWNNEQNKAENEFFVTRIKDGKIYGKFIKGNQEEVQFPFEKCLKLCSAIENDNII